MRERLVQSAIKAKLEGAGWFVTKLIQTSTNGIPDLLALKDGRAVFIECKGTGGRLSDLQKYMADKIGKQGFTVVTATSVDDIFFLLPVKKR